MHESPPKMDISAPAQSTDIVVIGTGPAGSTVAGLLAKAGYQVIMLERLSHPREHVGESVIPHFWKYCDRLDVSEKLLAEGFVAKSGGTVFWNDEIRVLSFGEFGIERPALHVERDRFDQILVQNSQELGAALHEHINVVEVSRTDDGRMKVHYRATDGDLAGTIECREVVDASGQNSLIARQFDLRELDPGFRFLAMWGYFENSMYVDSTGHARPFSDRVQWPPTTFVSSVGEHFGWTWHIPLREFTSVGLVLPIRDFKSMLDNREHETFFLETCRRMRYLGRLLEPAVFVPDSFRMTRDYSYRAKEFTGDGWTLVGDAAAFVDPIFSLGVTFAMYSGTLAAQLIDNGLRRPESMTYCRWVYSDQLKRRIATARALALPNFHLEDTLGDEFTSDRLSLELETDLEKSLIHTVAMMTDRSFNFHAIAGKDVSKYRANFRQLEEIDFTKS